MTYFRARRAKDVSGASLTIPQIPENEGVERTFGVPGDRRRGRETYPAQVRAAAHGDEAARRWVKSFTELGSRLGIKVL
jgi:hypothetical protein